MAKEVLSNKEAAEMLGITVVTLWRMRKDGRLDGCWFYSNTTDGRVLFVKSKLLACVAKLAEESA